MNKCCPMDGVSKRESMKELIWNLQKDIPNLKANLYGAIKRSNIKGWNTKKSGYNHFSLLQSAKSRRGLYILIHSALPTGAVTRLTPLTAHGGPH